MRKTNKKLAVNPHTIRALSEQPLTDIAGGRIPETRWTFCDQVPTQCYKPNPY